MAFTGRALPRQLGSLFAEEKNRNLCMEKADTLGEVRQRTLVLDLSSGTDKLTCLCLPSSQEEAWRLFPGSSAQFFLLPEI